MPTSAPALTSLFQARTFVDPNSGSLPYRLLTPATATRPGQKYPLVLFLHGAGERGSDNTAPLMHVVRLFADPANRKKYPCYVLAPQCPSGEKWCNVDWAAPRHPLPARPARSMTLVLKLLAELQASSPIDPQRLYVMGLSMGGYGTWDLMSRFPAMFAAAVPICGGGDEQQAPRLAALPVWVFHGAKDSVVEPARSRNMIKALRAAGGQPRYTEFPGVDHNSWDPACAEPDLLPWLFAQRAPGA